MKTRVVKEPEHQRKLRCKDIARERLDEHTWALTFQTSDGDLAARYHSVSQEEAIGAAIWVGGAGGGLDGPARGLYPAACEQLLTQKVAGLRLDYRYPNQLEECVLDTLLGVEFLAGEGIQNVALVGHSFGGAVVITAGAISPKVKAVVPMSTQTYGVELAPEISPRPLLIIHGTEDEILPDTCSRHVYRIAREPKELRLFEGAHHGLDEVRSDVLQLLITWITEQLSRAKTEEAVPPEER